MTVADFVLDRLESWGVSRIFGYPGDGINGFLGALGRDDGRIEFVQTRHEEMAAFMACGHAKFTGELGVCLATSGPGALHLLTGLYDAKLDSVPVVALVGQQRRQSLGSRYQQEIDLPVVFADVAELSEMCAVPEQAHHLVDRAVRTALSHRTVTALVFPADIQEAKMHEPARRHGVVFSGGSRYVGPRVVPREDELRRAAGVLNGAERVAMLVGQGGREAAAEIAQVAERLGAGVAKALLGKDVLPDGLDFVTGTIGLLGTRASYEMMRDCDALLMVGTRFPYAEWLPDPESVPCVQIDLDGAMLGMRFPVEVGLVGDAAPTLSALLPLLDPRSNDRWARRVSESITDSRRRLTALSQAPADGVNPRRVAEVISQHLPDRCLLTVDVGTSTIWYAQHVDLRAGMRASVSGTLASMGCAVPYAVAAKLAFPERPVIALVGDGAMQMNGLLELATAARYRDRFSDPRFVVCVFDNGDLNMVTWEQRVLAGDPKLAASQTLPKLPYADLAALIGFRTLRIEDADDLSDAVVAAFAAEGPALLHISVDPEVAPMPPHVTFEQATNLGKALMAGDENANGILRKTVAGRLRELVR